MLYSGHSISHHCSGKMPKRMNITLYESSTYQALTCQVCLPHLSHLNMVPLTHFFAFSLNLLEKDIE